MAQKSTNFVLFVGSNRLGSLTLQATRLRSRKLLCFINWLCSKLDDRTQSPLNTSNYLVIGRKASGKEVESATAK
jgi:hypothetical protein